MAFQAIKQAIANKAMASPDPTMQYHLAVDASKRGIGGVMFQLKSVSPEKRSREHCSSPECRADYPVYVLSP